MSLFFAFVLVFQCQSPEEQIFQSINNILSSTEFNGIVYIEQNNVKLYQNKIANTNANIPIPNWDTKVYLASITKLFTEIVIVKLIEEKKLSLEGTINKYRKNFKPSFGRKITIGHLLKMTSGLPRELDKDNLMSSILFDINDFAGHYLDTIQDFKLKFEPGSDMEYSNLNYWLLGSVIEEVTGLNLNEAYSIYIFDPLGMKNSGYTNETPIAGYIKEGNQWIEGHQNFKARYASGGCYSTLEDLIKLSKALKKDQFLNANSKHILYNSSEDKIIEIYGALPNYTNMIYFNHKNNITLIALNNIGVPDLNKMSEIKRSVEHIFEVYPSNKKTKKKSITLVNPNNLNDSIPLEAAMKVWINAIENGNKDEMIDIYINNSVKNAIERDDPTWDEILKHRNSLPNFRAHGYRWVEDKDLNGIEVWFVCDNDDRIAFLWIVDEKTTKNVSTSLFVMPDNMTWLGKKFN
ncbi:serine hydrolase [uncultured Psychroserpens sp.]|uniref:serine hydrolase domain-containing protein n=1 Tax=uncultured Psychroserpens sp. TaxID=255436 RepID=UPI00262D6AAB|nr:serine hydrolase domain-containing protein [uncultured Psychroserpens sp.]